MPRGPGLPGSLRPRTARATPGISPVAVDAQGNPHISYSDLTSQKQKIAVDGSGNPSIVYYRRGRQHDESCPLSLCSMTTVLLGARRRSAEIGEGRLAVHRGGKDQVNAVRGGLAGERHEPLA